MNTNEIPTPRGVYSTESMSIDEIPTPETNAVRDRLIVGGYEPHECFREWQNSHRDLERRLNEVKRLERERNETANTFMGQVKKLQAQLAIARETLIMIADESANLAHAERMADRALKQTASKP